MGVQCFKHTTCQPHPAFFLKKTRSSYVSQASLDLMVFLPQPSESLGITGTCHCDQSLDWTRTKTRFPKGTQPGEHTILAACTSATGPWTHPVVKSFFLGFYYSHLPKVTPASQWLLLRILADIFFISKL